MNNILKIKKECTGCRLCENVCPKKAINFQYDKEGFISPIVVLNECVNCGICLKKCPQMKKTYVKYKQEFYGYTNSNKEELLHSASGGFAFAASKIYVNNEDYVCGCIYDENLVPRHILSNKMHDIEKMQSSKYVQSLFLDDFNEIKLKIDAKKKVLFVGTPCQVSAIKHFIGEHENLLTIDIICHGVPSTKLFEYYIKWLSNMENSKVIAYNFRSKKKDGGDIQFHIC